MTEETEQNNLKEPQTEHSTDAGDIPRRVSFALKTANLFGFKTARTGWSILTLAILITAFIIPFVNYHSVVFQFKSTDMAQAQIEKTKKTFWSFAGKKLYKHEYSFKDKTGKIFVGKSYSVESEFKTPAGVYVKYVETHPEISSIRDMRPAVFSITLLLFPLCMMFIGLVMALTGYQRGRDINILLTYGRVTQAELKEQKETNKFFKGMAVYKLIFEYTDIDKKLRKITFKTHRTDRLSPDKKEPVFYDPLKYQKALIPLSLPSDALIGEDGGLSCENPLQKTLNILFPLSSIIGFVLSIFIYLEYLL